MGSDCTHRLRVGVVGAGPWGATVHAPMFAGHASTELVGVWGRRAEAAAEVAAPHGARAFSSSYDELLDACDAVSFAVPPDVQADMAVTAAGAGVALLLEKPIAMDVPSARRLVDVIDRSGVPTQLDLTWRYNAAVRAFVAEASDADPIGGRARFITNAYRGGMFATPWRLEQGPLLDVGPTLIDLLESVLGRVVTVRAKGRRRGWIGLLLEHENGITSDASIAAFAPLGAVVPGEVPIRAGVEVYTSAGPFEVDTSAVFDQETGTRIVDEFVDVVARGVQHELDARHGLHLQELLEPALAELD